MCHFHWATLYCSAIQTGNALFITIRQTMGWEFFNKFMGKKSFLCCNQRHQSTEGNTKNHPKPVAWSRSFFLLQQIPDGNGCCSLYASSPTQYHNNNDMHQTNLQQLAWQDLMSQVVADNNVGLQTPEQTWQHL